MFLFYDSFKIKESLDILIILENDFFFKIIKEIYLIANKSFAVRDLVILVQRVILKQESVARYAINLEIYSFL
jgi:hypothetical protein